jgi:hypothetical protein
MYRIFNPERRDATMGVGSDGFGFASHLAPGIIRYRTADTDTITVSGGILFTVRVIWMDSTGQSNFQDLNLVVASPRPTFVPRAAKFPRS